MARLQVVPQGPASLSLFCILVAVSLAFVAAESNNLPSALAKKDSLTVCVDDSDCSKDGSNYRCFMVRIDRQKDLDLGLDLAVTS